MTETILEVKSILLELQQKPKTCQMCGSLLSSRHAKYCSKPCHDKSKLRQVEITCETCGIIFSVKKSRVKNRKYCSTKCMGNNPEWRERNSKSHKQEGIKIACELCGNVFIVNKSKVKTRTHCSQKCRNADPKWRKKLSDMRIKNFAEKKRLVREKAIQQRDNFNKIMTNQIVVMTNSLVPKWENKLLNLVKTLRDTLPDYSQKMVLRHNSIFVTPLDGLYEECKSIIERHTSNIEQDGQRHFVVLDLDI